MAVTSLTAKHPAPGLGRILQRTIVAAAALATVMFATPLALAVSGLYQAEAYSQLAGDGERAHGAVVSSSPLLPAALPTPRTADAIIGIYDRKGQLLVGHGPAKADALVMNVGRTGLEAEGELAGQLIVAVPATEEEGRPALIVRVSKPMSSIRQQIFQAWSIMTALAIGVLVVVGAYGGWRARAIAKPLEFLADAADALGHGDFSVRAVRAGVAEVDAVSGNLERTARRLGAILDRERRFTADASHQLRTPLTAVRLGLESALITPDADLRSAARDALTAVDRLEQTVLDLLTLARDTGDPHTGVDVLAVAEHTVKQWAGPLAQKGREIVIDAQSPTAAACVSPPALRTVLDVLIGNALQHGRGQVTVMVRHGEGAVLVQVSDRGAGIVADSSRIFARRSADAKGTGIGLALARSLVEADGGRLELTSSRPTTFTLFLPPEPDEDRDQSSARYKS
jgi:signal transduction histidine kinase